MHERKTLLQRMDRLVRCSGIASPVDRGATPPRRFRWLPLVLVLISIAVFVGRVLRSDPSPWSVSFLSVLLTFSMTLSMSGPLYEKGQDERQSALRRDSYLAGFIAVAISALFGLLLIIGVLLLRDWSRIAVAIQCASLLMVLMQIFVCVPTLYASWALPPPLKEEERP